MPIVNRAATPVTQLASGQLPDLPADPDPSLGSIIGAAFRQNNIIGSGVEALENFGGVFNTTEPGYDAWNDIKGTPYEEHWQQFAQSNNHRYTEALKRQLDTEDRDRRTLDAGGWTGTLANIGANILDPTILIPVGGEIIKGAEGAYKLADVGIRTAIAGGVSTAVQEAALHATQQERTLQESEYAVGGGIVLGGLLGTAGAALLSKGERAAALKGYDTLLLTEGGGGLSAAPASQSLGLDALSVDGTAAGAIARATQKLSPNLRLNFSPNKVARQIGQELSEGTLYQVGHAEGLTTGAAVSRLAGMTERSRMASGLEQLNGIYGEMKKAGINMSFADFDDAVGRAMRKEDVGENDFVSRAAKAMRSTIVEPFFQDGKAVGLYEDGDDVSFAPSYFPRQYRTKVLVANEATIKPEWASFMEGRIASDYSGSAESLHGKLADLDSQVVDLNLSPDERAATLGQLEQQIGDLEEGGSQHLDRTAQINELRRTKPEGYRDEVARLREEGGQDFATFQAQRGALNSRMRRVDLGYAGLESRQQQLANSITAVEDANQRGLGRLVSKGRSFQRLADKLNPKKLDAQMSSLRTAFADVLARSDRALDRTARAAERLGDDAPAGMADRLAAESERQAARHERLNKLAERIEQAENLDPEAKLQAARDAIDEVVAEVADRTARRGEKALRLIERQRALDPARIADQVAKIHTRKDKLVRAFLDRWEIRNMGENVDPLDSAVRPDFGDMARSIVDDVYDKLTGRDYGSSASVAPEYLTPIKRGPVRERTLPIPDEMLERQGVLHNRASDVLHRYARTLSADVELTRKFGDPRLDAALKKIADEYAALRKGVTDPAELTALQKRQLADQRDIEALRDLVRGTYRASENASNFGRLVRAAGHLNFARSLGGVVVSSLSDIYRPAMVHGLRSFMGEGVAPLMKNVAAVRMSVKEARLAGTVVERVLEQRITAFAGLADPMERGTPIERALQNMSGFGAKWSGINIWTDAMKSIAAVMSQNRILDGSADARTLAFLGVDGGTAKAIRREFESHGEILDGVHVANTERWTDEGAVRAFRAAVGKDVDSIIVTPGVGDTPLFSHTPTGRLLLQFRSFMFASHQRVLLRGLQESKARFTYALVGMTGIGMLSATLKAWRSGRDRYERFKKAAENPGYLIGEGLDNAGLFTLGFDFANTTEKLTQSAGFSFNPIKTPMMAAGAWAVPGASRQGESIRFSSRSPLSTIGGPSAGMVESAFRAAGGGVNVARGKPVSPSQRSAAISLLPYNSFMGFREAVQALTDDSPYLKAGPNSAATVPPAANDGL